MIPKHQRNINGIEDKILSLYDTGMTTRDISEQIRELYDVEISAETVSNITNKILPLVSEWQNSQFRKVTKTKLIFPNDESLLKMLYLATEKIHLKWTRNYPDWDLVINQLKIVFSDVFSKDA